MHNIFENGKTTGLEVEPFDFGIMLMIMFFAKSWAYTPVGPPTNEGPSHAKWVSFLWWTKSHGGPDNYGGFHTNECYPNFVWKHIAFDEGLYTGINSCDVYSPGRVH